MSLFAAAPMASDWPSFRLGQRPGDEHEDIGLGLGYGRIQTSTVERPPLRSHKSFPHTLGTSNYATPHCGSPLSQVANPGTEEESSTSTSEKLESKPVPAELSVQTTFGGSAPASPVPQLTPTSAEADNDDRLLEDDDEALMAEEDGVADGEGGAQTETVEKTAAERRAEKRKMKRFRLTHNQTRFLMSEFARQAHPDAAQRERLSREIPGLSPRQVQVWFQNRRAKLKRLTNDDRERMMKSRALPEDFDITQTLHSPFGNTMPHSYSAQAYSTPMPSPASYASTYDTGMVRPLLVNGLRRESEDDSTISPVSISSNFGSFYTPPGSVPTSENMSPISPSSERAPFLNTSYPQSSPRNPNPFSTRSSSFGSNFHAHPHIPRLQLHDRVNRSRAESLASPLRTSMSYTGNLDYATPSTEEHVPSSQPSALSQTPRSFSLGEPSLPQSAGFNFTQGFQSSLLAKPRPTITTFPPGLDLRSNYRPLLPFSSFNNQHHQPSQQSSHSSLSSSSHGLSHQLHNSHHQTATTTHSSLAYASAPLAPPHDFQLPNTNDLYSYNEHEHDSMPNLSNHHHNENPLEPESYYKSEPESRRHMSITSRSSHTSGHPFSPSVGAQPQPQTPQTAGMKRRRDSNGENGDDGLGHDYGGSGTRRRSFTLPTGYGT